MVNRKTNPDIHMICGTLTSLDKIIEDKTDLENVIK